MPYSENKNIIYLNLLTHTLLILNLIVNNPKALLYILGQFLLVLFYLQDKGSILFLIFARFIISIFSLKLTFKESLNENKLYYINMFHNILFFIAQTWFFIVLLMKYKNKKYSVDFLNGSGLFIYLSFAMFKGFKLIYDFNPQNSLFHNIIFLISMSFVTLLSIYYCTMFYKNLKNKKYISLI